MHVKELRAKKHYQNDWHHRSAYTCIQYNICMHEQFNHLHNLRTLEKNLRREVLEDNIAEELTGTGKHSDILTLQRSAKESTTLHNFTPLIYNIYTCTWSCSSSTELYHRWYHAPKHLSLGNIPLLQRFSRKGNSRVTRFTTLLSWDMLVCWDVPILQRLTKDIVTSHTITLLEHASTSCMKFSCSFTSQHQKPKTCCCTVSVFWRVRQESLLLKLHTIHTPVYVHSVCLLFYLYPEWDQSHIDFTF